MKNKCCQSDNKMMTIELKKIRMSQVLLAKCNVIRISSFWNVICKNGDKKCLVTTNKKIFSFCNWYQCYLELDLLPLRFQQTPSQFYINHINWFQPLLYNQIPELLLKQLRFLFLWVWKRIFPGFYAKKAGQTLISDANNLWQASDNRRFIEAREKLY